MRFSSCKKVFVFLILKIRRNLNRKIREKNTKRSNVFITKHVDINKNKEKFIIKNRYKEKLAGTRSKKH